MVMFKVKESKFGATAGIYVGEFLGIQPFKPDKPKVGKDGKMMPPGLEWQFKILEGDQAGQIVGRITDQEPTTRNSCGKLLSGLIGRVVRTDDEVDPTQYIGRRFQVVVGPSPSDPERTCVVQIHAAAGTAAPAAPPAAPAAPAAPSGPRPPAAPMPPKAPPSAPKPPAPPAEPVVQERWYWVQVNGSGEPALMNGDQISDWLIANKVSAKATPCMTEDQSSGWKTAADFGILDSIPF